MPESVCTLFVLVITLTTDWMQLLNQIKHKLHCQLRGALHFPPEKRYKRWAMWFYWECIVGSIQLNGLMWRTFSSWKEANQLSLCNNCGRNWKHHLYFGTKLCPFSFFISGEPIHYSRTGKYCKINLQHFQRVITLIPCKPNLLNALDVWRNANRSALSANQTAYFSSQ